MADEAISGEARPRPRRRRSGGSKAKAAPTGVLGLVRAPWFGKALFVVMVLAALTQLWLLHDSADRARRVFGPVALGQTESEAHLSLGGDPARPLDAETATYQRAGRIMVLRFDPRDRRVAGVSCREEGVAPLACPDLLGVRIGSSRAAMLEKLGDGLVRYAGSREL
ncbi:MAG: hypothetical protein ACKOPE_04515, partial [Novosphingobium sp.]